MAEHERGGRDELAFDEVQIAVAQPCRRGADQHLAWPWPVWPDVFDHQASGNLVQDRGADAAQHRANAVLPASR